MSKKQTNGTQDLVREAEEASYHAYREWPLLLFLRLKELIAHRAPNEATALTTNNSKEENQNG